MKLITSAIKRTEMKKLQFNKTRAVEIKEFTAEKNDMVEFLAPIVLVLEAMFKHQ